jgi:hypothetical protein
LIFFLKWFEGIIKRLENTPTPLSYFFLYFVFIVISRNFLEFIYTKEPLNLETFTHMFISYLWVATSIMVSTKVFFPKDKVENIGKIIFSSMTIIILPPILDLIISQGEGLYLSYYTPWEPTRVPGFWKSYFTFFGSYRGFGATPGIQIELALGLAFSFLYSFFYKHLKIVSSVLYLLSVYTIVVVLGYFPYLFEKLFSQFNILFHYDHQILGILFLILALFNLIILLAVDTPIEFKILVKRIIHSEIYYLILLAFFGIILDKGFDDIILDQFKVYRMMLFFLSMVFSQGLLIISRDCYTLNIQRLGFLERSLLLTCLILTGYLGFLSFFFYLIFLIGNFLIILKIFNGKASFLPFCLGSVGIMSMGQTLIFPSSYPNLKSILIVFLFSFIIYFLKGILINRWSTSKNHY